MGEVQSAANHSARSIIDVNSGEATDAFEAFWGQYVGKGEKGWLRDLAKSARHMAEALDDYAGEIDSARNQLWTEIGISATVIVGGVALTGFTFGLSDAAAAEAASAIISLGARLGVSLSATAVRIATSTLVMAAFAGVESATLDLAVAQPMRIAAGQQDGISLEEVNQAAKSGMLWGAATGPFASGGRYFTPKQPIALSPASLRSSLIKPRDSRAASGIPKKGEPVDVATGDMIMEQTDLSLPGDLPLTLSRTHLSSDRAGVCFGPSWASTLDEHIQLDPEGVVFAAADGMRLVYPVPEPEVPVLPKNGPRWFLEWDGKPDGVMTVTDPVSGVVRTFAEPGPTSEQEVVCLPLESWQDRNGQRVAVERNAGGVPTGLRHSGGYYVTVETEGRRVTALRLLDKACSMYEVASSAASPGTTVMRYAYDAAGNLAEVINSSGEALCFTYDDAHRMLSWQDRNGTVFRYEYDAAGRVAATVGPDGIYNGRFSYDLLTRTTAYTNSLGHQTRCRYNEDGHVVAETDPLGHTTRTEWNAHGTQPLSVTDALGHTTRYTYDAHDNLTSVTLPDGTEASAAYNELSRPIKITEPGGAVWRNAYDQAGNVTETVDPCGAVTRYRYDAHGRPTAITDALGHTRELTPNGAGLPVAVRDALGHTTHIQRDTFGRVVQVTDPLGHTTRMAWTVEGRPRWREDAEGGRESWTCDGAGNLLSHTTAGHTTRYEVGPFDAAVRRVDSDGAAYAFTYDTEMRLVQVTNPHGLKWSYEYDAAGRLVAESDFNGARLSYGIDAAGRLIRRTNAAGQTLHYERDAFGNVSRHRDEATEATTHYTYDSAGNLVGASSPECDLELSRDPLGRVLSEATNGRTVSYAYDALGRRTRRITPSGLTSTWTYDAEGRATELVTDHGSLCFAYDAAGRETQRRTGSVTLTQRWDAADRLTEQEACSPSALLQQRTYAYRADGHLTEIRELTTGTRRFDLDGVGRVTGVRAHGWGETYAYDAAGNLTTADAPGHPDAGERDVTGTLLHRAGRRTYVYDAAGRRISACRRLVSGGTRTWTYQWNAEDRLTELTDPAGGVWTYTYDPLGRRIRKSGPDGEAVDFVWDGNRLAEQSFPQGSTTTWDYTHGTHRPLAQTDHKPLRRDRQSNSLLKELAAPEVFDPRFHAVLTDATGTPMELVTPDGRVTWQQRTTLWGASLQGPESPLRRTDSATTCPLRFPGQYHDFESGLYYNYFRYYDPGTARYLTPDPLGLAPGPNDHVYVDNPLAWVDPLGLTPCSDAEKNAAGRGETVLGPRLPTRNEASVGHTNNFNYKKNFFQAHPDLKGKVVVHHAIEQQVLKRYPGLFSPNELHSVENLRGIPKGDINSKVHLSEIRKSWNDFYASHPNPTRQQVLDHATQVDDKLGHWFAPRIR